MKRKLQIPLGRYFIIGFVFLVACHKDKYIKVKADCPCHEFSLGESIETIQKNAPGFELDSNMPGGKARYILSDDCDVDSIPVGEEITATTKYERVVTISAEFKSEKSLSSLVNLLKTKYKDRFQMAKSATGNYYVTYDFVDSNYYFFYKVPRMDTANYVIKYEIGLRDEVINRIKDPEKQ